jgi:hypothetical protein
MKNFGVKSIVHDYEVEFIEDTAAKLRDTLQDGDWVIIDNKIKSLYGEILKLVPDGIALSTGPAYGSCIA